LGYPFSWQNKLTHNVTYFHVAKIDSPFQNPKMKQILPRIQPYLRWAILGGTLFYLVSALIHNWDKVRATKIESWGWLFLVTSLGVTLVAHGWAGWVWGWILRDLNQPVQLPWATRVYLKTNIAKYLPGNVWHYYGRVSAAKTIGIPLSAATLSILLEPMFMAASALLLILIGSQQLLSKVSRAAQGVSLLNFVSFIIIFSLVSGLVAIHPGIFNPLTQWIRQLKAKVSKTTLAAQTSTMHIQRYPVRPLLGELLFLALRGTGFVCILLAFQAIHPSQLLLVYTTFGIAWLAGLVIPGMPGGIGVFEAVALTLLNDFFDGGVVFSAVALYRLISILAETLGAGFVWAQEYQLRHQG
jgi:hypothetical protein